MNILTLIQSLFLLFCWLGCFGLVGNRYRIGLDSLWRLGLYYRLVLILVSFELFVCTIRYSLWIIIWKLKYLSKALVLNPSALNNLHIIPRVLSLLSSLFFSYLRQPTTLLSKLPLQPLPLLAFTALTASTWPLTPPTQTLLVARVLQPVPTPWYAVASQVALPESADSLRGCVFWAGVWS